MELQLHVLDDISYTISKVHVHVPIHTTLTGRDFKAEIRDYSVTLNKDVGNYTYV